MRKGILWFPKTLVFRQPCRHWLGSSFYWSVDTEQDLLTSVTTFPSVTVAAGSHPWWKRKHEQRGRMFCRRTYFGNQQRYSQILVCFLLFLRVGYSCAAGSQRRISPCYISFSMPYQYILLFLKVQLCFLQGSCKYVVFGDTFCSVLHIRYIWRFRHEGITIRKTDFPGIKSDAGSWSF